MSPATQPSEPKKKRAVGLFKVTRGCQLQKSTALRRLCTQTVAKGYVVLFTVGGIIGFDRHPPDLEVATTSI